MIDREIKLLKDKSFFLFGPRQTGKSTLLKGIFPADRTLYYDLLKSDQFLRLTANPSLFREEVFFRSAQVTHVVIDEVQKIPLLLDEVHHLMESPNPPCFILTGSSARKLKRTKANLLAGRALTSHLHPLTAEELGPLFSLTKSLQCGTLPSVYLEEREEVARERLRSYVETYLKEEIEIEAQVRQIGAFIRFLTIAGTENGHVLNFSNISRDVGTNYQTVKSYFQILEDTLIGWFLFPYQKSLRKRHAQHPKFYFFDTGVVRALTKQVSVPLEPRTPEFGRAFEHFVLLEILRWNDYARKDLTFSFYRTESGAEVDLIVETPEGRTIAVEIKAKDDVSSTDLRGLRSFAEVRPKTRLVCLGLASYPRKIGEIVILPWQQFRSLFDSNKEKG